MPTKDLRLKMTPAGVRRNHAPGTAWLWHGYLHAGDITLLTSQWKSGKTTLVSGLLRQLAAGGEFLGLPVRPGKAWLLSEESPDLWADRLDAHPVGEHVDLLPRPFRGRPTPQEWADFTDEAAMAAKAGELHLLVVDSLAAFLPGHSDSDAGTVLAMFQALQGVASAGAAVLVLHHPRRERSAAGATARGSGALLGFADVLLELNRTGPLKAEHNRRLLAGQSRRRETPAKLWYEWAAETNVFTPVPDWPDRHYEAVWQVLDAVLKERDVASTHLELLADWPDGEPRPSPSALYNVLNRATAEKRIRKFGSGTRGSPWKWRHANEDDKYYDKGMLPPLKPLRFRPTS